MKSESTVAGSSESETSALIVAVFGIILKVQDYLIRQFKYFRLSHAKWNPHEREDKTHLLILKLYQIRLILNNLIPLILTRLEKLRQRKPLPRHLVPVVRVNELVVVDAVRRVSLHALDRGFAAVEGDDVVHQGLARW